ncbi:MAG TPA: cupredoxin domain-containing protein [Acidimicrobiales bacterium]|jgi:plastocyanin|nr:cupredoxin domain-containing protein [Acidimicrobiales bacterium]
MRRLLAVVCLAVLPLAACGDDDADVAGDATTTSTTSSPTTGAAGGEAPPPPTIPGSVNDHGVEQLSGDEMDLELDDFYFEPTFVHADPGQSVTVRLHNEGDARHTFTIPGTDVDAVVAAGEDDEVQVTLPSEGPVVFVCRFHEAQGMRGAFYFTG